jgi:hypothetical protein
MLCFLGNSCMGAALIVPLVASYASGATIKGYGQAARATEAPRPCFDPAGFCETRRERYADRE